MISNSLVLGFLYRHPTGLDWTAGRVGCKPRRVGLTELENHERHVTFLIEKRGFGSSSVREIFE